MLKEWRLAISMLVRECRAGQWLIVFFALILAVTSITTIHFFTDRLARGLNQQSAQLLGGNLVITSPTTLPEEWAVKAKELSLRTADVLIYPSVVSANNHLQLVNVQAVSNEYPLFGKAVRIKNHAVLTESRLLPLLNIDINDNMTIGAASFSIQGIVPSDIEMMNTGWVIAPRVLMRLDDVPSTKIVLPGSRVNYELLLSGSKESIGSFKAWLASRIQAGQKLIDVDSQRTTLTNYLEFTDKYIQLVILLCLLMCGTAIALSVRQHMHRHYNDVALWRCLGSPEKQITGVFLWQLITIAVISGVVGTIAGYILQSFIAQLFKSYINFQLPSAGFGPVLLGFLTSTVLLFCYAYPIVSLLPRTSPLYLWRSESSVSHQHQNTYAIITLVLLLTYVYWIMDFSLLALFILDSLLLSIGFLYVLNILSLSFIRKLVKLTNGAVRRGLSQFIQYPETAGMQLTAFTLIVMSLFILSSVKNDLLLNWKTGLPANTPNYFAFNIAPYDLGNIEQFFKNSRLSIDQIYPMVRGRLVTLNNKPIMQMIPDTARNHNALHRELNISSMQFYPSDNKIVDGTGWNSSDNGKLLISIEKNLASELRIKIGDSLGFQIGDQQIAGVVANIRSVDWGSFHPNFYIIFPPDALDRFPSTYITSFHLPADQTGTLNQLVKEFPNVTVVDIANILRQVQDVIGKLASALTLLFTFAILAAILIFAASLLASMDERRETYQLLRVLGASRKYIISSLVVEFSFLAVLTLGLSYILSTIIAHLLITVFF
jgi:putative ABC transport system permease protein